MVNSADNHVIKRTCSFLFSINLANIFIIELQNLYMCLTEINITPSLKNKNPKYRLICNHNQFLTYLPKNEVLQQVITDVNDLVFHPSMAKITCLTGYFHITSLPEFSITPLLFFFFIKNSLF